MKLSSPRLLSITAGATLFAQVAGAGVFLATANAADFVNEKALEYTQVELGTGWYLRGDIAGSPIETSAMVNIGNANEPTTLGYPVTLSAGGGYRINEFIRAEIVGSQFTGLQSSSRTNQSCGTETVTIVNALTGATTTRVDTVSGTCYFALTAAPTASAVTANVLFDGPEFWGVTPYVGGGAGIAYISWNDFESRNVCVGAAQSDCGTTGGAGFNEFSTGEFTSDGAFALSWNLMAGVGYKISDNLTLDFGYRYSSLGAVTIANAATNPGIDENIDSGAMVVHEVRVGLRYDIW